MNHIDIHDKYALLEDGTTDKMETRYDVCTDNRFEVIEHFKRELIEATNIETSPKEMEVIDNILFRFWQLGWLENLKTICTKKLEETNK